MPQKETLELLNSGDLALVSQKQPLRESVRESLSHYFEKIKGVHVRGLYNLVLAQVEEPLLKAVLQYTHGSQTQSALLLGLNRGTLRKKMKHYGLLD